MNENVAFVGFLAIVFGAAIVSGGVLGADEPAPLVDDLRGEPAGLAQCHLGATVDGARLDAGERLLIERDGSYGDTRTDSFRPDERASWGADAQRGANVTVYRVDRVDQGNVDVLERARLTADCRLVGRAAP